MPREPRESFEWVSSSEVDPNAVSLEMLRIARDLIIAGRNNSAAAFHGKKLFDMATQRLVPTSEPEGEER